LHINGYTSLGSYRIAYTGENDKKETLTRHGCLLDTETPLNVGLKHSLNVSLDTWVTLEYKRLYS